MKINTIKKITYDILESLLSLAITIGLVFLNIYVLIILLIK
jgi:hypothetical protein